MAIQDSFNLSRATTSQAYAYKCWYNYNYGGNTMNISSKDMSEITASWSSELKNWKANATNDENKYEIEDDEFTSAKAEGKATAKGKTGYDGKKAGMVTRGVVDAGFGLAGALGGTVGKELTGQVGKKLIENTAGKMAAKATTDAACNKADKVASSNGAFIITAPLALATGTAYMAKKPNKDAKEACDDLQDEMVNAQAAIAETQGNMADMDQELLELSDEAAAYNEDANNKIEDDKSEFDLYKASYDALIEKLNSGEELTDDEKALLAELVPIMQELGVDIDETSEDTSDIVSEIYGEMDTYQDGFDTAAETIGEVEGLTDYAEGFDEATRTMCYVEAGAQGLNAFSGAKSAAQAGKVAASGGPFTSWAWAFAAMGATGAALSGVGTKEQFEWAGQVGNEIGMRKDTQDLNSEASGVYDERIDDYAGYVENVEELELEIPDDMDVPEEGVPAETGGEDTTNSFGISPEKDDKEKEEE